MSIQRGAQLVLRHHPGHRSKESVSDAIEAREVGEGAGVPFAVASWVKTPEKKGAVPEVDCEGVGVHRLLQTFPGCEGGVAGNCGR